MARSAQTTARPRAPRAATIAAALALLGALVLLGGHVVGRDAAQRPISSASPSTTTPALAPAVHGAARPIALTAGASNGRTRIERGLPCGGGEGDAGYWHLQGEHALPPGVLTAPGSPVRGDLRLIADVHSPHHVIRATPEPVAAPGPVSGSGFLLPDASRVSVSNARGGVEVGLAGGGCPPDGSPFAFDGASTSGAGTWSVVAASGAYRDAIASGTYSLQAGVLPGADNTWSLGLAGTIKVLQPDLDVRVVRTFWGRDGVDFALRQMAAVYRVTNIGAGDTYGAALTAASSPTPGASLIRILVNGHNLLVDGNTPVSGVPRALGDLGSGESVEVTVVWQLPLPSANPPCRFVIFGCTIATSLSLSSPDALDLPVTKTVAVSATAPNLPPPL